MPPKKIRVLRREHAEQVAKNKESCKRYRSRMTEEQKAVAREKNKLSKRKNRTAKKKELEVAEAEVKKQRERELSRVRSARYRARMKEQTTDEGSSSSSLHVCVETYKEVEDVVEAYEVKHIVRYFRSQKSPNFNVGHEPWRSVDGKLAIPNLKWESSTFDVKDVPYITVARITATCQYGKKRTSVPSASTCKIGCPCQLEVVEVLRLIKPQLLIGPFGLNPRQKRTFADTYRENIKKGYQGLPHELVWKREFHLTISPLSSHNHVIGEGAASHQRLDPVLILRIRKLASSGITALDVIRDDLIRYVEEELFRDKEPPLKADRRFYPQSKDISNHVDIAKNIQNVKKHPNRPKRVTNEKTASTDAEETFVCPDDGLLVRGRDVKSTQQKTDLSVSHTADSQGKDSTSSVHNDHDDITEQSADHRSDRLTLYTANTGVVGRMHPRNAKEKSLLLAKKLCRIIAAVDNEEDLRGLNESLINIIMAAKSMIPAHRTDVLFEEEPRVLKHPRRMRPYNKRAPAPRKQLYPDINLDAMKHPDRRALRAEAKKKKDEARARRRQNMEERRERRHREMLTKTRKVDKNSQQKRKLLDVAGTTETVARVPDGQNKSSCADSGQPPRKVSVLSCTDTTPVVVKLNQPDVKLVDTNVRSTVGPQTGSIVTSFLLNPINQSLVRLDPSPPSVQSNNVGFAAPRKAFKIVPKTYSTLLPKPTSESNDSIVLASPLPGQRSGASMTTAVTLTLASCTDTPISNNTSAATAPGSTGTATVPSSIRAATVPGSTRAATVPGSIRAATVPGSISTASAQSSTRAASVPGITSAVTVPGNPRDGLVPDTARPAVLKAPNNAVSVATTVSTSTNTALSATTIATKHATPTKNDAVITTWTPTSMASKPKATASGRIPKRRTRYDL